ncbi:phosphonate C-P lyase system protein PhnG [Enemella sp. A6]|uniref:phosphonate C-P lyase system protein PhnG n=1 Tax=Enemella sp. A6 TaxID=3440152 RepID=UPI003EBE4083
MNPTQLWSLLAAAPGPELEALADQILAATPDIEVVTGPEVVSVPLRWASEAGEVIIGHTTITTCQMSLAGTLGDGVRPGRDLPGAVAAAVCAAEVARQGTRGDQIRDLAHSGERTRKLRAQQRADLVEATRLDHT